MNAIDGIHWGETIPVGLFTLAQNRLKLGRTITIQVNYWIGDDLGPTPL